MQNTISPEAVRRLLVSRQEIALLDVREENEYARSHPLFAASLPLSQLEMQLLERVPRASTTIVVYDANGKLAPIAARRAHKLGYENVHILDGGLEGWRSFGFELFQDLNSASKAFGELVEVRRHTPSIPAEELNRLIADGEDMVILDARRFDEYQIMSIPTAVSVPGAELAMIADFLAPAVSTKIVVNCAGRTRSIIGAQSLINAGFGDRVMALRNGTIGWTLAGLTLDHGADRRPGPVPPTVAGGGRKRARNVAYRAGVRDIDLATLQCFRDDPTRTTYCFDVRLPTDFEEGHLVGFANAQGGQLVQETDTFAPVRGARIVLHDILGGRAYMTSSWLAQMNWEVYVLDAADAPLDQYGRPPLRRPSPPDVTLIAATDLAERIEDGSVEVIDLGPSPARQHGHIPGSHFAIRSRLDAAFARLATEKTIVLVSPDGALATFAAADVARIAGSQPLVLAGGFAAWRELNLPIKTGSGSALNDADDVYRRPYEGSGNDAAAMQAYLDWEYGLVAQLERDGSHGFYVI